MFAEAKDDWQRLCTFFAAEYGEDPGIMFGVYEHDEFEVDLFVGEETGRVFGLRAYQVIERHEQEDAAEEGGGAEGEKGDGGKEEEDAGEADEGGEGEEEGLPTETVYTDLFQVPSVEDSGKPVLTFEVPVPEVLADDLGVAPGAETPWLVVTVFSTDGEPSSELTHARVEYKLSGERAVLGEHPGYPA